MTTHLLFRPQHYGPVGRQHPAGVRDDHAVPHHPGGAGLVVMEGRVLPALRVHEGGEVRGRGVDCVEPLAGQFCHCTVDPETGNILELWTRLVR